MVAGTCSIENGSRVCSCTGNYYGTQCQLDGEVQHILKDFLTLDFVHTFSLKVLAVAVGASVAAAIIIILTLVCLCMWRSVLSLRHNDIIIRICCSLPGKSPNVSFCCTTRKTLLISQNMRKEG